VLVQSDEAAQFWPFAHRGQLVAPPQSMSDSPPFLTLSLQPGAWHKPVTQ
jgi:hypothetical protein